MNERMKAGSKDGIPSGITISWRMNRWCPEDSDSDGINDDKDNCPNQSGPQNNNGCPSSSSKPSSDPVATFIKFLFILLLIATIIGIILFIWKRRQKKTVSRTRTYDDDTRIY